jgi:hypothetical protein
LYADVLLTHFDRLNATNVLKQTSTQRSLSINSEEARFKRAKKDLLTSMPATVKEAIIMQTSSDMYDVREIQAWRIATFGQNKPRYINCIMIG